MKVKSWRNLTALRGEREARRCLSPLRPVRRSDVSKHSACQKQGTPGSPGLTGVSLRPVVRSDLDVIRRWLRQPEVEEWWGPASATTAEVQIAVQSPSALCRIVQSDGVAVGYCHAIDAQLWGDHLPEDLEPGTWDLDLFIGSAAHRGQGIGLKALDLLRSEVFSTTLAPAVCIFASIRNEAAVRAYEKAGFRWQRLWTETGTGPCWFMVAPRP